MGSAAVSATLYLIIDFFFPGIGSVCGRSLQAPWSRLIGEHLGLVFVQGDLGEPERSGTSSLPGVCRCSPRHEPYWCSCTEGMRLAAGGKAPATNEQGCS